MQKRTILALLSLGVLLFCVIYAAQSNTNIRDIQITEKQVANPQVGTTETDAQIQEVSDNNAAAEVHTVVRLYNVRASWYRHGKVTANGERFNPLGLTVAHRSLPFGTIVRFTNPENGQSVTARVNDRGPYIRGRDYDLSLGTARALDMEQQGVISLLAEIM